MKKRCELCKSRARIHCDSDRASLCWTCDARVHSANFLVARHSRILLCQICQSFTPWRASGEKLCPSTASICATCAVVEDHVSNNDIIDVDNDSDDVLSQSSSLFQPPPVTSSSSSDEILTRDRSVLVKRKRSRNVRDLNREYVKYSSSANKAMSSNSTPSASGTTFENIKRIRKQDRSFDDHITVEEEVHGNCKSATMLDLDLNASP